MNDILIAAGLMVILIAFGIVSSRNEHRAMCPSAAGCGKRT